MWSTQQITETNSRHQHSMRGFEATGVVVTLVTLTLVLHHRCLQGDAPTLFAKLLRGSSSSQASPSVLTSGLLRLAAQLRWQDADMDESLLTLGVEVMSVLEAAADSGHFCGPQPLLDADLAVTVACNILSAFGTAPAPGRFCKAVVQVQSVTVGACDQTVSVEVNSIIVSSAVVWCATGVHCTDGQQGT
jgi:hypothetical protein